MQTKSQIAKSLRKIGVNMKKSLILMITLCIPIIAFAFDYIPKSKDINPFANQIKVNQKVEQAAQSEIREIKNLNEYFKYLPAEVHRNWTPYKSETPYEVTVQFHINRDGSISDTKITNSTNDNANTSVLNAVKTGAPYQPLPESYPNKNGVNAQIILEYKK